MLRLTLHSLDDHGKTCTIIAEAQSLVNVQPAAVMPRQEPVWGTNHCSRCQPSSRLCHAECGRSHEMTLATDGPDDPHVGNTSLPECVVRSGRHTSLGLVFGTAHLWRGRTFNRVSAETARLMPSSSRDLPDICRLSSWGRPASTLGTPRYGVRSTSGR